MTFILETGQYFGTSQNGIEEKNKWDGGSINESGIMKSFHNSFNKVKNFTG